MPLLQNLLFLPSIGKYYLPEALPFGSATLQEIPLNTFIMTKRPPNFKNLHSRYFFQNMINKFFHTIKNLTN